MFQTKDVEKIETHFGFNNFFLNRAVYEMTWENNLEPDEPQITRRMRFACWIQETTNIHSEYETSFFTANSGCKNVPQCYTTLPTLSKLYF